MKKFLSYLLTCSIGLTISATFFACDSATTEHTHDFEETWSNDDTFHWYACTEATCTETSQKAAHAFENNVCTVCSFEKNAVPSPTDWKSYFNFETIENVTATSTYLYDCEKVGAMQQYEEKTLKIRNEQRLLLSETSYAFDMDQNGEWVFDEPSFTTYYFDGVNVYKDGVVYEEIQVLTLSEFYAVKFFADYENAFSETSTGVYECIKITTDYGDYKNVKIVIEDNKIRRAEYAYFYDGITSKFTLTFSDWGTTAIN